MSLDRRGFLQLASASVFTSALASQAHEMALQKCKAVAFDAFPIFDFRPIFALAEDMFPGKGAELSNVWRTRQFEYQWLRALSGHYADFWQATQDALVYAAKFLKLTMPPEKRKQLMQAYLQLKPWPDVVPALDALKKAGIRLALLSNFTQSMLETNIRSAQLDGMFEHVLSTDRIRTYKPDPRAYQMAIDAFGLRREEIIFAAFAGWDAAGAKSFGYRTVWVNRIDAPIEELGVVADATVQGLADLVRFATAQ